MFDNFGGDDDVVCVVKCPFAVEVDDGGFDAECFFCFCKHLPVDVEAGDGVAGGEVFGERAVAAADVEDVFSRAYPLGEHLAAFCFEHGEVCFSFAGMVVFVDV